MEPSFSEMIITKQLAQTKNSVIWLIQHENNNKDYSILKAFKKEGLASNQVEMIKRERKFYEENKSNNYPCFIKAYQDATNVYIEMTLIEGLNMSYLLKENLLHFNYKEDNINILLHIIAQITQMLIDLHKSGYIYRDLKMNNLIIDDTLKCHLIDFGFVKKLDSTKRTSTICGTLHMKAPELFLTQLNKEASYGFEVDIYALGVLIYELFTGKPPFPYQFSDSLSEKEYIDNVLKGINDETHFSNNIYEGDNMQFKDSIIDLIKGCMKFSPKERYILNTIKSHRLFDPKGFDYYLNPINDIDITEGQGKEIIDCIKFDGEYKKDYYQNKETNKMDDLFADF